MTIAVAVYAYCPTVRILLRKSTAGQWQYATRRYAVYPMLNCAELLCANAIFKCW